MILIIDNYDSFTYNIVQIIGLYRSDIKVVRNDKMSLRKIGLLAPSHIIISPGPCTPDDSGICLNLIKHVAGKIPLLGICLGHQCIAQAFGGKIVKAPYPVHGKTTEIYHDGKTIFRKLRNPFRATRYHSLIIDKTTLPDCLVVSASADEIIMGIRHKMYSIEGVQFHPESFLTLEGKKLLRNFITIPH